MAHRYLLEVGCEEIPAKMVARGVDDLGEGILKALAAEGLPAGRFVAFGGARRLAVAIEDVPERQADTSERIIGPPVDKAFDPSGRPTRAGEGFARRLGIDPAALERVETPRGPCVAGVLASTGRTAAAVLAEIVPRVLAGLTFAKTMRWGRGEVRFVRPVRGIVSLLDDQVVELSFAGVAAGRASFGHRFLAAGPVVIADAGDYARTMSAAHVEVDPARRRAAIRSRLAELATEAGGTPDEDATLLDEVAYLVEEPHVFRATFDPVYLTLPKEVLVSSLKVHQKSFPIWAGDGGLIPGFLAVANVPDREGHVTRGYAGVLRARLEDARFFWTEDRKRKLESRVDGLDRQVFQEKLGSYGGKTRRLQALAPLVARGLGLGAADAAAAAAAARLAKADLATEMVGEFPELQGIAGGLYVEAEGGDGAVARAIYEHYRPTSYDGPTADSPAGRALAVADKLDTLIGCFGVGLVPSGTRDPLGLRRAAQGVIRTLLVAGSDCDLEPLLTAGAAEHEREPGAREAAAAIGGLRDYLVDRLAFILRADGSRADTIEAVTAVRPLAVVDCKRRVDALDAMRARDGFDETLTVFKRVANIAGGEGPTDYDPTRPRSDEEAALDTAFRAVAAEASAAAAGGRYADAIERIGALAAPLHRFFEKVLVMDPDPAIKANRLALLRSIGRLAAPIADFSKLQIEKDLQ